MGGIGSGVQRGRKVRTTVEECFSIDVRRWAREGYLEPGRSFNWRWTTDGAVVGAVSVEIEVDEVVLAYRAWDPRHEEWQDIEQHVPLEWTPCHFGGTRPWFLCMGFTETGRRCGRRAAKIFVGDRQFACRTCCGLAYQSQNERSPARALRRAQRTRVDLGGSPSLATPFPDRPKYMRWSTYAELRRTAEEAERAWADGVAKQLGLSLDA